MRGSFGHNEKQVGVVPCACKTQTTVLTLEGHYVLQHIYIYKMEKVDKNGCEVIHSFEYSYFFKKKGFSVISLFRNLYICLNSIRTMSINSFFKKKTCLHCFSVTYEKEKNYQDVSNICIFIAIFLLISFEEYRQVFSNH